MPVTVVCGLPGSGKSELVQALSTQKSSQEIAFAVPEGHNLLECADAGLSTGGHRVTSWVAGDGLSSELSELDGLIVEAADAVSSVAFSAAIRSHSVYPDTIISVFRARSFLDNFGSNLRLVDRGWGTAELAELPIVELLVEYVETATHIVFTGMESLGASEQRTIKGLVTAINPAVSIFMDVPKLAGLIHTHGFHLGAWWKRTTWALALQASAEEESPKSSFVFRARRPFHPTRFQQWLQTEWPGVLRAKGRFWLASRLEWVGLLSQAGAAVRTEPQGYWWAVVPPEQWPDDPVVRAEIQKNWHPEVGDCRQELAFVGVTLNEVAIRNQLEGCLLTEEELEEGPDAWKNLQDPFPVWTLS